MKLYIFLDESGEIVEQVRAENHDEAMARASTPVSFFQDFYAVDAA